jgi:large subunit ribosomal protein L1
MVGEEDIFDAVKSGNIDFERCLCHTSSHEKLLKSGIARLLGPKGMMPNPKSGTVLKEVGLGVESLRGGLQFRERTGVIRLPIGRLNHTPDQLQANIRAVMNIVKRDVARLNEKIPKTIHDVVSSCIHRHRCRLTFERY